MEKISQQTYETGTSIVVDRCQVCGNPQLKSILFLGYLPPPNSMPMIGEKPREERRYPAQLLYCPQCHLVQSGCIVDPKIIFPPNFLYTSSSTKILRDNFAELYQECKTVVKLDPDDLIVDIGSNDGNLLSNFKNHRVLGITPEEIGRLAMERGIPTIIDYFNREVVSKVLRDEGPAKIITATNVFAHMDNIHEIIECILELLTQEGLFISESHYLPDLIGTLQYDAIYHEHLRYYSLHSLKYLFEMHGLEIIHARRIPTHGGSFRAYAARRAIYPVRDTVLKLLNEEKELVTREKNLHEFRERVVLSKLELQAMLLEMKKKRKRIYGIGAAARASTLLNYVGIDEGILDCVVEVKGSYKIGKYIAGTLIPVVDEVRLFDDQPDYALLLSWHIADELAPKLKKNGFKGDFIIPLPTPHILKSSEC